MRWKVVARRAGLAKVIDAHSLGHRFATPWLQRETDLGTIQALRGHEEGATTMIYSHLLQQGDRGVATPPDDLWDNGLRPLNRTVRRQHPFPTWRAMSMQTHAEVLGTLGGHVQGLSATRSFGHDASASIGGRGKPESVVGDSHQPRSSRREEALTLSEPKWGWPLCARKLEPPHVGCYGRGAPGNRGGSCAWESAHTEGCKSLPGGASRQTTERNCVLAIRAWRATGSERIVRRTAGVKTTATRTRYGLMRLTRLRAMSEVRSTAASPPGEAGAKPVQNAKHRRNRGAWGGWRRNVRKCVCLNRGDLSWCWKEQGRSQSPHSSRETGNDRGAKGGRKVEA